MYGVLLLTFSIGSSWLLTVLRHGTMGLQFSPCTDSSCTSQTSTALLKQTLRCHQTASSMVMRSSSNHQAVINTDCQPPPQQQASSSLRLVLQST
jgi:hypothetical protein